MYERGQPLHMISRGKRGDKCLCRSEYRFCQFNTYIQFVPLKNQRTEKTKSHTACVAINYLIIACEHLFSTDVNLFFPNQLALVLKFLYTIIQIKSYTY